MLNVRPQLRQKGPLVLLVMLLASGCAALAGLGDFSEGTEKPPEDGGNPGFVLGVEPSTVVLAPKEDMTVTVTLAANPPLRQDAFVRVDGLPPGVTAGSVAIGRPSGNTATGTLVFHADADAGRVTTESQVIATADPLRDEAPIEVRVLGAPVVFDGPITAVYVVPEGVTAIYVKMWGAGGGAGMNGAAGGAGAFVFGRIEVTPREALTLRIGAGGGAGTGSEDAGASSGGGGAGLTGIFRNGNTPVMIAGAGGGGGALGYGGGITTNGPGAGGSGGGDAGAGGGATGGAGATVGGGGAAGSAGSCGGDSGASGGRALAGGTGAGALPGGPGGDTGGGDGRRAELGGGGGGGAGAFGGGGGGCGSSIVGVKSGGGGGGGGSSLAPGKEARILDGNGVIPGGTRDVDYDGRAGKGGAVGAGGPEPGARGRIVIRY